MSSRYNTTKEHTLRQIAKTVFRIEFAMVFLFIGICIVIFYSWKYPITIKYNLTGLRVVNEQLVCNIPDSAAGRIKKGQQVIFEKDDFKMYGSVETVFKQKDKKDFQAILNCEPVKYLLREKGDLRLIFYVIAQERTVGSIILNR